jgi:hypothetical protein
LLLAVGRGAYGRQAAELQHTALRLPPRGSCSAKRNGCLARLVVPPEADQGARAVALISSSRRNPRWRDLRPEQLYVCGQRVPDLLGLGIAHQTSSFRWSLALSERFGPHRYRSSLAPRG